MSIGTLALVLLIAGGLAWWLARRLRAASGLPAGRLLSADTSRWLPTSQPLFSRSHRLTGKPDYVLRERDRLIPIELKAARAPAGGPHAGHVLQLAAYCLLLAEREGQRPPYGIIQYADAAFRVDNSPGLERRLLDTLEKLRRDLARQRPPRRSHADPARCAACGYRHACDERLA